MRQGPRTMPLQGESTQLVRWGLLVAAMVAFM